MKKYSARMNALVQPEIAEKVKTFCLENHLHESDFLRRGLVTELQRVGVIAPENNNYNY